MYLPYVDESGDDGAGGSRSYALGCVMDQRACWATVVGLNVNGTGPVLGPFLNDFLRSGAEFAAPTLSRFYAIHMMLLPGAIAALIGAHLYLVARLGTTAPPWIEAGVKEEQRL